MQSLIKINLYMFISFGRQVSGTALVEEGGARSQPAHSNKDLGTSAYCEEKSKLNPVSNLFNLS